MGEWLTILQNLRGKTSVLAIVPINKETNCCFELEIKYI